MARRAILAALLVGTAALAGRPARGASDYEFGMALVAKFGFDEEAERFFTKLQKETDRESRLTGSFGLGGIMKLRADQASRDGRAEEATKLYVDAKKLIDEFLKDSPKDHPDRGAANAALLDIEKSYLQRLKDIIKDPAASKDAREKALREAKAIIGPLIVPLRDDKKATQEKLKKLCPPGDNPDAKFNRTLEAAFNAMVRYVGMALEEIELYDRKSKERKDSALKLVKELQEDLGFYEENDLGGVVLRLYYEIGRANVAAGDLKKADESFKELLEFEPWGTEAKAKEWIENLQLYAYYTKAKAYFDAEKWDETIKIVDDMFGALPQALNEDQGNGALLFKAEALFRKDPPDYQGAVREATKIIDKNLGFWPNNAYQLLAKVLAAQQADAQSVPLSADILHGVAVGEVQRAYRERDPSKRLEHFEKALDWLQKTIAATRAEGAKLDARLKHGPTAWFELGVIYANNLGLWYEARFAFEAVLRYYAKDVVGRSLAELPKYRDRIGEIKKEIKAGKIKAAEGEDLNEHAVLFDEAAKDQTWKALLAELDTRLKKSANNLMVAARRRHNESKSDFDLQRLSEAIIILIQVDPAKKKDLNFHLGLLARQEAEGLMKAKKIKEGVAKYEEACAYFLDAAKERAARRELAYHLAGMAYYQLMTEVTQPEVEKQFADLAKRAPEFGEKALEAFAGFEREAKKYAGDEAVPDDEKAKRDDRMAKVDIARPVILMALGKPKEAVAAADTFLAREDRPAEHVPTVAWTRLRALKDVAVAALGTRDEAVALAKVVEAADGIKRDAPNYEKPALSLKAAVFNAAAEKLSELAEKADGAQKDDLLARADEYSRKNAEYTNELIKGQEVTLPFLLSLFNQFFEQKAYLNARELCVGRILKDFDPNGTGQKMVIPEDVFESAAKSARLGDYKNETALRQARERIKAVKELVFGEPIEQRRDKRYPTVVHPSKKMNWSKAFKEIDEILKEAPTLPSKSDLGKIKDELVYRIQMMTVRLNLADCDMALARKFAESKPEEAGGFYKEAAEQLAKVCEYYWRDNELRFTRAEAYEALGELEKAKDLYIEAAARCPEDSPNWYKARIAFSQTVFRMAEEEKDKKRAVKLIRRAMGFADLLVKTSESEDAWKKAWPEAADFVTKCEAAIEARGEKIKLAGFEGEIKEDKRLEYEMSAEDLDLITQINIVENRIKTGTADEKDREGLQREAFEVHLSRLPDKALKAVIGELRAKKIKKEEAEVARRRFLVRFLYQSPFKYYKLQKHAVKLGVIAKEEDAIPVRLLSDNARKVAQQLGYITKDGELVPRDELPESDRELLRKELGAVEEEPGGGAGGAPEAAPDNAGAAPGPEDAPAPGEADAPADAEAPEPEEVTP